MVEPISVTREQFPKSLIKADGMQVINPVCDNYELAYYYDVEYAVRGSRKLFLQIIEPVCTDGKVPLIVYIPGSAFYRQEVKGRVAQLALLAVKGYAVALLEYRGSEEAGFPAIVVDAKAGITYMKKHSEEYNVDADKIFVMGDSSGGYTALMAGLTNGVESLEDEFSRNNDYSVRGIIDFYGPTDITTMNDEPSTQDHRTADSPEGCLIGCQPVLERRDLSEPTIIKNYVADGRKLPPVIMFHGSNDELVPFGQSCQLYTALKENGHEAALYQIDGAHHGDRQFWSEQILGIIDEFIKNNCLF